MTTDFATQGWLRLGATEGLSAWAEAARGAAEAAVAASPDPWRHGGTWFVGLEALPNDASGAVGDVALPWADLPLDSVPLHRAQVSVIRPGYPGADPGETAAAIAFRRSRDAAHLDGLLPMGPERLRMLREPHAWILGIALNEAEAAASPLVVWEGSHRIMAEAFARVFAPHPPAQWDEVDATDAYAEARRQVFATCPRRELPLKPGEATLLHRMTLHGVAPWAEGARAAAPGRMIAYFRPELPSVADWLRAG